MRKSVRTVLIAAALTVAGVSLAGCTGTGTAGHTPTPTAKAAVSSGVVSQLKTQPGTSKGYVGALKDVTTKKCETSGSSSTFSGTVKNPEKTAQSYRIYVSLLKEGSTIGIDEVDVRSLAAGATKSWSGHLPVGGEGVTCVLRVERNAG